MLNTLIKIGLNYGFLLQENRHFDPKSENNFYLKIENAELF